MEEEKLHRTAGRSEAGPCHVETRTKLVPEDAMEGPIVIQPGEVSSEELSQDVIETNPDINTLDRG